MEEDMILNNLVSVDKPNQYSEKKKKLLKKFHSGIYNGFILTIFFLIMQKFLNWRLFNITIYYDKIKAYMIE